MAADPNASAETTLEGQTGESPADVKALLKQLGLTPSSSMAEFSQAVSKSGGLPVSQPQQSQGVIGDIVSQLASRVGDPIKQAVTAPLGTSLTAGFSGSEDPSSPAPAPKPPSPNTTAGKGTDKGTTTTPTQSPYEELANALASSYLQQVNQLEPLISGQGIYGTGGETDQAVQAASAMAPGAGGWLGQQAAAEKTASAPLQAAMGQVGNAEAAGAIPAAGAIANTGLANTEYLQSAPYQQILSELANETAYKAASSGASAFGSSPLASSPLLQSIFTQLGLGTAARTPSSPTLPGAKTAAKKTTTGTASTTGAAQGNNPTG